MTSTWTRTITAAVAAAALGGCGSEPQPKRAEAARAPQGAVASQGTIAYQTDRGGSEGVWLVGANAERNRQVATDVPDDHLHPDWSPDGRRLLFTKRADKDLLFEGDAEGRGAKQILDCDDPCIGDDEASYSPDGKRIAFIRTFGPLRDDRPADCSLWVLDRASGKARRLSRNRGCVRREAFPRWSPDGRTLVYFREKSDEFGQTYATAIFTRPADGGGEKQLTPWKLDAGDPDWSPDGERIVFSTSPFVYFDGAGEANLFTMRPDGSDRRQLTRHGEDGPHLGHPRWTPDGKRIVHVKDTGTARELWLVDANGGQPAQITAGGIFTHPVWRPAATPKAPESLVAIGDSVALGDNCDGCETFVDLWARELGVEAHNEAVPDSEATDVLDQVKNLDTTREAISAAGTVVVQLGINDTPWNLKADPCRAAPEYPVVRWKKITGACIRRVAARYERTLDAILAEVKALRGGKPTTLRLTTVYNATIGNHVDPSWDSPDAVAPTRRANELYARIQCRLAKKHGGECVDVLRAFNGPDGSRPAKRWLASDYTHPNERGHARIARLLQQLGA